MGQAAKNDLAVHNLSLAEPADWDRNMLIKKGEINYDRALGHPNEGDVERVKREVRRVADGWGEE